MFKQFVRLLLIISFLETTASPTLQQEELLLNQFTKVYSLLKNSGYSDSEITQLLLSTPELAALGNVNRLKKDSNTALYFAIGAGIGATAVVAGTTCYYGYAHYKESKRSSQQGGNGYGSKQNKTEEKNSNSQQNNNTSNNNDSNKKTEKNNSKPSINDLPAQNIDLPRSIKLTDIGIKGMNTRSIENLNNNINDEKFGAAYRDYGRFTPLHYTCTDGTDPEATAEKIEEILIKNKIKKGHPMFNAKSKTDKGNTNSAEIKQVYSALEGSTPLAIAALSQDKAKVVLFLNYGSDPAIQDCNGNTALHNAVANIKPSDSEYADSGNKDQLEMVDVLIKANPKVLKIKNNAGFTPLEYMTAREKTRVKDDKRTERAQKQFEALTQLLS